MNELLTMAEHRAMVLTSELWQALGIVVGCGSSRQADLDELASHLHAIQTAVLAQAAGRAFPDLYRLLGEAPP